MFFCGIALQTTLMHAHARMHARTHTHTHLTSRCGIFAKHKQPYVAQSEVRRTLALTPISYLSHNHYHDHRVACLRCWGCMASLRSANCARESVAHALITLAQMHTRRRICLHNVGSCSLRSSSASRRILVMVVREQMNIPISPLCSSQTYLERKS